ncbi:hypothetical protein F5Y15DRAFT_430400 [Xylariaceae sp. FL0016]|nr:hypothetical protein F5Y15DRAFT_430400 [Xylariaceae sp. FL0016]
MMQTFMTLYLLTSLTITPPLAASSVLQRRISQETQEEFDQTTASFTKSGSCRSYFDARDKTISQAITICQPTCAAQGFPSQQAGCLGSAEGPGIPESLDPDGDRWIAGVCECDVPIANEIAALVIEALPVIGDIVGVACAVIFNVLAEAVLDAIPDAKGLTAAWRALIKGAKGMAENGLDSSDYQSWIFDACGGGPWVNNVNQIFDTLSGAGGDSVMGVGCRRPDKKCITP